MIDVGPWTGSDNTDWPSLPPRNISAKMGVGLLDPETGEPRYWAESRGEFDQGVEVLDVDVSSSWCEILLRNVVNNLTSHRGLLSSKMVG